MSDNVTSIFHRFSVPKKPPSEMGPLPDAQKQEYEAVKIYHAPMKQLRIHYSNGDLELLNYASIHSTLFIRDTEMSLMKGDAGGVFITGVNLRNLDILDAFQGRCVHSLLPFDENIHRKPEEDVVVIDHIFWKPMAQLIAEENS